MQVLASQGQRGGERRRRRPQASAARAGPSARPRSLAGRARVRRVLSKGRAVVAGRRRVRSGDARKHEELDSCPRSPGSPPRTRIETSPPRARAHQCVCEEKKN